MLAWPFFFFLFLLFPGFYEPVYSQSVDQATIHSATDLISDSFEGTPPNGWSELWTASANLGPHYTTNEAGTPSGGGSYAYCQAWTEQGKTPKVLIYYLSDPLGEGDVFELEYWIKYDGSFDFGSNGLKQIIAQRGGTGGRNEFYIIHLWGPQVVAFFQHTTDSSNLYANKNGSTYLMPAGEWVHFRWRVKVSVEANGNPRAGYLHGWVDGVQRWKYENINTISQGKYETFNLNTTFNSQIYGSKQKRFWDLVFFRLIGPDDKLAPASPELLRKTKEQ